MDTETHREGKGCEDRVNTFRKPSASYHQKLGERAGTESPSPPSEETSPADTSILDLWPPELRDNKFLLPKPHLAVLVMSVLGNEHTAGAGRADISTHSHPSQCSYSQGDRDTEFWIKKCQWKSAEASW